MAEIQTWTNLADHVGHRAATAAAAAAAVTTTASAYRRQS